jgi:transmembrane sensor
MTEDRRRTAGPASPGDPLAGFPSYQGMELATLRRYVLGESPEAERRRVAAWAAEAGERRRYLEAMRELHAQEPGAGADARSAAWARIAARLDRPSARVEPPYTAPWDAPAVRVNLQDRGRPRILAGAFAPRRAPWTMPLAVCAGLLVAAVGLRMANRAANPASTPATTTMRRITTTRGQRAEIRLDDGTQVMLGVASRLEFPSDFGTRARDVYLDGTADFRVVHDTTKPFTVHTANAVTRDVGTHFVVRAYPTDGSTEVVVSEGSVALGAPGAAESSDTVLRKDQLGVLAAGASRVLVRHVDPSAYTAWMRGQLVFRDTPLSSVVRELGRWYATPVELGDSALATVPFSAAFGAESLREAVTTLTTVLPLRAVREGDRIVLYRKES